MNQAYVSRPIVITLPYLLSGEVEAICALMREPMAPIIHVRKPVTEPDDLTQYLTELSTGTSLKPMTFHYHELTARQWGFGGVHLHREEIRVGMGDGLIRSYSEHRLEALNNVPEQADYLFLSPIFDSISKQGYQAAFEPIALQEALRTPHQAGVIALGGITPDHAALAAAWGFDGVASLGDIWHICDQAVDPQRSLANYRRLARRWRAASTATQLQFISDGNLTTAEAFLEGGGRWIQLRMKGVSEAVILARGAEMLSLCRRYDALFILNDDPYLCLQLEADGVHLGEKDMSPTEARTLLGERYIIGATANRADQIMAHDPAAVDYIGLGPYRFTSTKEGLSPLLGAKGYEHTLQAIRAQGCTLPVVGIGGVELEDVSILMQSGLSGIALSGSIARSENPTESTRRFLTEITL